MKTILSPKIHLKWVLWLFLLVGTLNAHASKYYTTEPCDHQNVFTLTAKLTHNSSVCTRTYENLPHHFISYSALILHKEKLDAFIKGNENPTFYRTATFQENNTSSLDLPLLDYYTCVIYDIDDYVNVNIDDYYVIICIESKSTAYSSDKPLYESATNVLSKLRQSPIPIVPNKGIGNFEYNRPALIKLTDFLQTTLSTKSYNPSCETVEFQLQTKCKFVIDDAKPIYQGYPYYIELEANPQCNSSAFISTPNTYPTNLSFNYSPKIFNWVYTYSGFDKYISLPRKGNYIQLLATDNPDIPVGTNIVLKVTDGWNNTSDNAKVVCFYPDLPQPTKTGFQRIPEGQTWLHELKLKFNRNFESSMEETPTLLTVYSKVGQSGNGGINLSESQILFQEKMEMSKFNGLTYTTSVINHPMTAGTYYVTVEGTVRNKSNHPDQNGSLPGDIQTAIFQAVPFVVGQNDIDIEKIEFTPPICHGEKGKLKLTIAGCFLPYLSQYPIFYYRTGENSDGEFTYDTINFRCTYSGTQNDRHATFECDHVRSHQTYFKIVIPPILQGGSGGIITVPTLPTSMRSVNQLSASTASTNSNSSAYDSKIAYFQIDFTQPDELDFPVEVKHNSGYYYVNGQMKMADDGKITVYRSEASGGTPPYSFFYRDDFANLSDKPLTSDVLSTPHIGNRYITIRDAKGCSLTKTVSVGNLNGKLYVKLATEREISCYNANDGILKTSIEQKTDNPLRYSWYKNGVLLSGKNASMLYDLEPGTYQVVLTDTKTGMASSDEITLTQPTRLNLSVQQKTDVDCFGDMSGSLALKGSGGVAPYLYLWDGVDYGSLRRNLPAGTYQVKLIDHNSCELTESYTISQPDKFEIIIDSVIHAHYGTDGSYVPGSILWHSQGGTKPYKSLQSEVENLSRLDSGTYRLAQYDAKQCKAEQEVKVNFYDKMQIKIVQDQKILCAGEKTAACHVEIEGGFPPFDIKWNNGKRQASIDSLPSGFYSVKVTDAVQVAKTAYLFIPTPAKLVIDSLSASNPTYYGCDENICLPNETDGKINFTVTGGTKPYSEQWQRNGKDIEPVWPDSPNLSAGKYELHITDKNGCEANRSFYLADIEPLRAQIEIVQPIDCHGNPSGILQAKASGGTPPYRYVWENLPDTLATLEHLPTGTYKVSVSDTLGVEATASLFLGEPEPLRIVVESVVQPSYPGSLDGRTFERVADGQIRVSATGGSAPYRFEWSGGNLDGIAHTSLIEGLSDGIYRLQLRDHAGCLADTSFELPHVEALSCSVSIERPVSCFGLSDAVLQAQIEGGTSPYDIRWLQNGRDSAGNAPRLENRACADYVLMVTDSLGVRASFHTYLPQPDSLQLRLTAQNGLCFQDSGGFALALVQGGTLPYRYHWNVNGAQWSGNDSLLPNLENADIALRVSDSRGCAVSSAATVTAPLPLELEHIATDPSYSGSRWQEAVPEAIDGKIELLPRGGTAPYRFFWDEEESSKQKDGLDSGSYHIAVQDAHHCRLEKTIHLKRTPNLLTRLEILQAPLCADSLTGAFRLSAQGGQPPYTFDWYKDGKWIGEDSVYLQSGMGAGVYKLTLRDANGIKSMDSLVVREPERISAKAQIEDASAWTIANGSIHVDVRGGVPPYTLFWSNGTQGNELSRLRRGLYVLDIYDANLCHFQNRYTVGSPDSLFISSLAIRNCCPEAQDGSIKLSIQGGLPPYRYDWKDAAGAVIHADSGVERLMELNGLAAGSYRFYLRDSGGAEIERLFEIENIHKLEAALLLESPIHCHGESTAAIQAWIRGGKAPYECTWHGIPDHLPNPVRTDGDPERLENLPAGDYRLSVLDANGDTCSVQLSISQAPALALLADIYPAEDSDSLNDGYFILRPQGGRPPYRYLWNTGNTAAIQEFSRTEKYEATVTDAEGCTARIDLDSVVSQHLRIRLSQTADILCFGEETGALKVEISNGKPPFSIRWSNGSTESENRQLAAGLYSVSVTDAAGRSDSGRFLLRQPEELRNEIILGTPSCHGFSDGSITVATTGGNGHYAYAWNTGEYTPRISNLAHGTYIVRVSDRLHCMRTDTILLPEPAKLRCGLQIDPIVCPDEKGRIDYHAEGGTAPYRYHWSLHKQRNAEVVKSGGESLIDPAEAGWYELQVSDLNHCVSDTGAFLANPVPPSYKLENEQSLCNGQSLSLRPEGCDTASDLQFLWIYPDGRVSNDFEIKTQTAGLHKLTIIQNLRCFYQDSVNVSAFDDSIHAEFWVSSHVTARQSCLLVNLSEYAPDSITWHIPQDVKEISREGNYLEVRFPAAGTYTIGMTSYKGACSESTFRQVEVLNEQNRFSEAPSNTRIRWQLAPNPTRNECLLKGESDRKLTVRYRLVRAATGHIIDHGTFQLEKDSQTEQVLFNGQEAAGMYILLLEYGNEKQSFKIVKL